MKFRDPAAQFEGWEAFGRTFSQFASAEQVGLDVLHTACAGRVLFIHWRFKMKSGRAFAGYAEHNTGDQLLQFNGVSVLEFGDDDRVRDHEDSWTEVPDAYRSHLR